MEPIHVLIADDDPDVLRWLRDELAGVVGTINLARDGAELQAQLRRDHFDLVITDVQMPGHSGPEVAEAARRRGDMTPFIFFTGSVHEQLEARVRRIGRSTILQKPVSANRLIELSLRMLGIVGGTRR
jgi:CheY-like chemotaxis protein